MSEEGKGELHLVPVCIVVINYPTYCPPGNAEGAFDLRNRGHSEYGEITCWPSLKHHPLYHGGVDPSKDLECMLNGMRFWNQELYVYLRERKSGINKVVESLSKAKAKPRVNEYSRNKKGKMRFNPAIGYDSKPHPEDFGNPNEPTEEKLVEKWLRDKT